MATLRWGKVYYGEYFAGYLREEPGDRTSFTYDENYLNASLSPLSHTLPLRIEPFTTQAGLHPFFDNLVAEGWLQGLQTKRLDKKQASRFELLLAFGQDCAGAVSVVDPKPVRLTEMLSNVWDLKEMAAMTGRASLSGFQPKLILVERDGKLYPTKIGEISTHIAKFPSANDDDLVINEYLTTLAFKALLPEDTIVDLWIGKVEGVSEQALIIKRFDRDMNRMRIHFEEFNQLLGNSSEGKYNGAYKDMADFIRKTKGCLPIEVYRLYLRILAGFLLGNTDMHLKNFAMLHTAEGLRLTPSYDQVAGSLYQFNNIELAIGGSSNLPIGSLKPRNLIKLGEEFQLRKEAIKMAVDHLGKNKEAAKKAITTAKVNEPVLKNKLIELMEKRWNGTFALIGLNLSKKP